jgi:hypothetical protein
MIARGMTLEHVKAADPAKGFRTRYGSASGATDRFVEAVFNGLSEKK